MDEKNSVKEKDLRMIPDNLLIEIFGNNRFSDVEKTAYTFDIPNVVYEQFDKVIKDTPLSWSEFITLSIIEMYRKKTEITVTDIEPEDLTYPKVLKLLAVIYNALIIEQPDNVEIKIGHTTIKQNGSKLLAFLDDFLEFEED